MRKSLVLCFVFCLLYSASSGQTRTAMQRAVDTICHCMNRQKIDTSDLKKMQALVVNCFTTVAMPNLMELAAERGLDITDEASMQQLAGDIGKELMKQRCEAFIRLSMVSARVQREEGEEDVVQLTSGILVRVDNKDFRYLIVRDQSKRDYSFIWYGNFDGSLELIGDKINKYIGKNVTIRWKEKEVYLPSAKNYFKIKEISGIEF